MKKITLLISVIIMIMFITSCAGIVSFRTPGTDRVEGTAESRAVEPVLFEGFESGPPQGTYSYANTAAGASAGKFALTSEEVHSGQSAVVADFNTGTSSEWGCGIATGSTKGTVDAKGTNKLEAWVYAPENKTFYFFVNESGENGADAEYYNSPSQTGSGKWQKYEVYYDEFFKNIYSGNQAGNNDFDATGIGTVGLQFGGNQGKGKVYVDDIYFVQEK